MAMTRDRVLPTPGLWRMRERFYWPESANTKPCRCRPNSVSARLRTRIVSFTPKKPPRRRSEQRAITRRYGEEERRVVVFLASRAL